MTFMEPRRRTSITTVSPCVVSIPRPYDTRFTDLIDSSQRGDGIAIRIDTTKDMKRDPGSETIVMNDNEVKSFGPSMV